MPHITYRQLLLRNYLTYMLIRDSNTASQSSDADNNTHFKDITHQWSFDINLLIGRVKTVVREPEQSSRRASSAVLWRVSQHCHL